MVWYRPGVDTRWRDARDPVLEKLEGDNASGEPVSGLDFWLVGAEGAAGSYSSNAGRRVLLAKMKNLLPPLEGE